MADASTEAANLLRKSLGSGRIHTAYLISGGGGAPAEAALVFARGLACSGPQDRPRPCDACSACQRSQPPEQEVAIDGKGKAGPLFRHIGDHPDLFWVARGEGDTRVRIGQIRAVQSALRLGSNEGGWRAVVIADAEWLNAQAQNALLKLLEEPPDRTCVILVAPSAASLLTTIRSRCARVAFPSDTRPALRGPDAPEEIAELVARFDRMTQLSMPELLDWAEEYRGARGVVAERVQQLIDVGAEWLREHVAESVRSEPDATVGRELDAFQTLLSSRRELVQRNANPQMVAERSLFAMRESLQR